MTGTARALYNFWSGFGMPAYTTTTVPDDAELPYITYSLVQTEPLNFATHYAQVWYRDTSNEALMEKVAEILEAIGTGVMIATDDGYVCIRPGSGQVVQLLTDENPEIRYAYINLQINCYNMGG